MIELTADDIKAMRAADDYVTFHRDAEGNASIRLSSRVKADAGWQTDGTGRLTKDINLGEQARFYRGERVSGNVETCYWSASSPRYDGTWVTMLRNLRPGDRLTLVWSVNYDITGTNHIIAAGLVGESFEVRVQRPGKGPRDVVMTFKFGSQILPAGNPICNVRFKAEPSCAPAAS